MGSNQESAVAPAVTSGTWNCPLCDWQLVDRAVPSDKTEDALQRHYTSHETSEWVRLCAALAEEVSRLQLDVEFYRRGK